MDVERDVVFGCQQGQRFDHVGPFDLAEPTQHDDFQGLRGLQTFGSGRGEQRCLDQKPCMRHHLQWGQGNMLEQALARVGAGADDGAGFRKQGRVQGAPGLNAQATGCGVAPHALAALLDALFAAVAVRFVGQRDLGAEAVVVVQGEIVRQAEQGGQLADERVVPQ